MSESKDDKKPEFIGDACPYVKFVVYNFGEALKRDAEDASQYKNSAGLTHLKAQMKDPVSEETAKSKRSALLYEREEEVFKRVADLLIHALHGKGGLVSQSIPCLEAGILRARADLDDCKPYNVETDKTEFIADACPYAKFVMYGFDEDLNQRRDEAKRRANEAGFLHLKEQMKSPDSTATDKAMNDALLYERESETFAKIIQKLDAARRTGVYANVTPCVEARLLKVSRW